MALCSSCLHGRRLLLPGEARPGCLLDKRKRDEMTASMGPASIQYARAKIKLRALFPDATRIEINPQQLEVEGLPLLPLLTLGLVLKVLAKVWGDDTHITPDFSAERELLRVERDRADK